VDQRLRVWRSVASFLLALDDYVTKCPSNKQDLHTRLSQHFKNSVGACDQHVRDEENTQLDKIHIMTVSRGNYLHRDLSMYVS
jgi:hypothetical protein